MAIILFILIFAALYVFLGVEQTVGMRMTVAETTVDSIRSQILNRLNQGGKQKKLEIMKRTADEYLKKALVVGVMVGLIFTLPGLFVIGVPALLFLFVGLALSVVIAEVSISATYQKWQEGVLEDLPALIDFLPAFLESPSITPRQALENTIPFLPGALGGELKVVVDNIKRTGDAKGELMKLAARVQHPAMDAICRRLAMTWDASATPDLFTDLREEMSILEENAAAKATAKKKSMFVIVSLISMFGLILLAGVPVFDYIIQLMTESFGG
ncbi:MAG TPA: hypothetical protein DDZ91_09945 [Firmicutes bacterium]|nr:hypothetical protein [Bacillota bacterium]